MNELGKRAHHPRFAVIVLGMMWFVFCIIAFSNVGFNMLLVLIALPVTALWGVVWLVRLVIALRRQHYAVTVVKNNLSYWLFEPVIVVLPLVLALSGVFSSARFLMSEQALSNYAEHVRASKVNLSVEFGHPSRRVGLYSVTFTDLLPDGTVRVLTSSHDLLDRAGFANSPHSPPPRLGGDSYKHIHQQWWYWYESW